METNQIEKKSKKPLIISIIIATAVLAIAAIVTIGILRFRSGRKMSKSDKVEYTELVMLYNEALGKTYTYDEEKETNMDTFVYDINSHMLVFENIEFTSSIKIHDITSDGSYTYSKAMTFYGLNSLKYSYNVSYNVPDEKANKKTGVINMGEASVSATFETGYDETGYWYAKMQYETLDLYAKSSGDDVFEITKNRITTPDNKEKYTYDIKNSEFTMSNNTKYSISTKAGKLVITTSLEDDNKKLLSAIVSLIVDNKKYSYEYSFGDKTISALR